MHVAIVAESFLPQMNGVVNSVLRVAEHLDTRGHEVTIVAPGTGANQWRNSQVLRIPGVPMPGYSTVQIAVPGRAVERVIEHVRPDLIHAAAPAILGGAAIRAGRRRGIPVVGVYQTDVAGFAEHYGLGAAAPALRQWIGRVHRGADLNLAPSSAAQAFLSDLGVDDVHHWPRGVDLELFHPERADATLRERLAHDGQLLVGYVGRLAREKAVDRLAPLEADPRIALAIVGDGPERARLERVLPTATFLGFRSGEALAACYATFDLFVHTGVNETFCQTIQEALASGTPVVAPACGGPLDLVEHDGNGRLWHPTRHGSLPDEVRMCLDPILRRRYAGATRASVAHRSWTAVGDLLLDFYGDARGRRRHPSMAAEV